MSSSTDRGLSGLDWPTPQKTSDAISKIRQTFIPTTPGDIIMLEPVSQGSADCSGRAIRVATDKPKDIAPGEGKRGWSREQYQQRPHRLTERAKRATLPSLPDPMVLSGVVILRGRSCR